MFVIDYGVMNSPKPQKPSSRTFLAFAAAGVVLLLLAISASQLELGEGYAITLPEAVAADASVQAVLTSGDVWMILLRGLMALCLIALPIYVVRSFFSKKGRQQLLADVILIGLVFLLMRCANDQQQEEMMLVEEGMEIQQQVQPFDMEFEAIAGEPLPEIPQEAPDWVNTVVIILVSTLVVAIVVTIYIFIQRKRAEANKDSALDRVADQAQDALRKIRGGGDFNSAILNCYYEMNRIVQEELKISRQRTMTARDFEAYLINKGLPEAPLQQLTALFERARYSNQAPDGQQEQTAIEALTSLVETVHAMATKEEERTRMRTA